MAATDPFLSRILTLVRDLAMDPYDAVRWTDAKILTLVDAANSEIQDELASAAETRTQFRFDESTIDIVAAQEDYFWPGNFKRFRRLVKKDDSGNIYKELLPTQYLSDLPGIVLMDSYRGFRITPKPTESDSGWTLVYEAGAMPYLHYGTVGGTCSSTTIVFDSTPTAGAICADNDFYNNAYVNICSGTGQGQIRRITDYVGSTYTATVTPAFTTTPTVAGNSVYEIMPCLRYPDDLAIAWRVVMLMKGADGDQTSYPVAEREFQRAMRTPLRKVEKLQKRQGPAVADSFLDVMDYGDFLL